MGTPVSQRAYSRHRGVSHTSVRKALAAGRITAAADGRIDPELADAQWNASTDPSKPSNSVIGVPKQAGRPAASRSSRAAPELPRAPRWEEASDGTTAEAPRLASSYAASRAAREAYLARLAKLEFEQRSAKLIDADEVRAQMFALSRRMRDSMLGLADRLAPVLAGQADPAVIHRLLSAEITASLSELSVAAPLKPAGRREAGA